MCTGDPTWGDPETDTMTGTWLPSALCSGHKSIHGGGGLWGFPFWAAEVVAPYSPTITLNRSP